MDFGRDLGVATSRSLPKVEKHRPGFRIHVVNYKNDNCDLKKEDFIISHGIRNGGKK